MNATEIDLVLQAFRAWKTGAYSCRETPGRWLADCPTCGDCRTVEIIEWGDGGRASMSCRRGCSQGRIVAALSAARDIDPRDAKIAELRDAVDLQRSYIGMQERLIVALLDDGQEAA